VVLNTLTEHDFQDILMKRQKRWDDAKRNTSKVMLAISPKVSFDQMAAPVPRIMDVSFYMCVFIYIYIQGVSRL
jgi:hypothetical protein